MSPLRPSKPQKGLAGPQTTPPVPTAAAQAATRGRQRVDTKPLTAVAARGQHTRRAARAAITARLAPVLTPTEQRLAEAIELHLEGRVRIHALTDLVYRLRTDNGHMQVSYVHAALRHLHTNVTLRDALAGDCPPLTRCDQELCAWHRRALKRWWDTRDPIVRALLADKPATHLARIANGAPR